MGSPPPPSLGLFKTPNLLELLSKVLDVLSHQGNASYEMPRCPGQDGCRTDGVSMARGVGSPALAHAPGGRRNGHGHFRKQTVSGPHCPVPGVPCEGGARLHS